MSNGERERVRRAILSVSTSFTAVTVNQYSNSNTHCKFRRTVNRQRLLGRISGRARSNYDTSALTRSPHIANRQLDKIQYAAIINIDYIVTWLQQLASLIESIFKIIVFFRDACVGDRDVDGADLLERSFEILPGCSVTFDKGGVYVSRRRYKIEDKDFSAFSDEDLDRCEPDARCATCKAGENAPLFM